MKIFVQKLVRVIYPVVIKPLLRAANRIIYRIIRTSWGRRFLWKFRILQMADVAVTEKCTLKCRYCVSLMPYFQEPKNYPLEQVCADIDVFFKAINYVNEIKIIGGEPFVYKQICEVILHLKKHKRKYGHILIITNGTIMPGDEVFRTMRDHNVRISISYYGSRSVKYEQLYDKLKEYGIECNTSGSYTPQWIIQQQPCEPGESDIDKIWALCYDESTPCRYIANGRIYWCNTMMFGDALRAFPEDERNYALLSDTKAVQRYLFKRSASVPFPACAYCSGRYDGTKYAAGRKVIWPGAEQCSEPVEYKRY